MIVVIGATGNIGPHLVRTLAAQRQRVRVAARQIDRARALIGDVDVEWVHADVEQPNTLEHAFAGASAVFCGVGGASCAPDLDRIEARVIDAAKAAGAARYVKVSGIDSRPDGPSEIQRIHGRIEAHLRASGLPAVVLRPSFFMQNFLGLAAAITNGQLPMPTGQAKCGLIDARDVAEVAAAVLVDSAHVGHTYTLTGPESLSHGDCAEVLAKTLGRPVTFVDLPAAAWQGALTSAGLPSWFAERLTNVYRTVFAEGLAARVTDDVPRLLGRPARSLATFAADHRAVFSHDAIRSAK